MSLELWFVFIIIVSCFTIEHVNKKYHKVIGTFFLIFSVFLLYLYIPIKAIKLEII